VLIVPAMMHHTWLGIGLVGAGTSASPTSLTLARDEGNPSRLPGWCSRIVVVVVDYYHSATAGAVMRERTRSDKMSDVAR
jgi:hypothetical protein